MTSAEIRDQIAAGLFVSIFGNRCKRGLGGDDAAKQTAEECLKYADMYLNARSDYRNKKEIERESNPDEYVYTDE